MIIAPHEIYAENINRIIKSISGSKCVVKYSEMNEDHSKVADVLIIDSIGLLSSVYKYGNLAYIGGGFGKGIHNILEAATFGLPIIFGPKYEKFKEAVDLVNNGGAFSVSDYSGLMEKLNSLLNDTEKLHNLSEISSGYIKKNKGATESILKTINISS